MKVNKIKYTRNRMFSVTFEIVNRKFHYNVPAVFGMS